MFCMSTPCTPIQPGARLLAGQRAPAGTAKRARHARGDSREYGRSLWTRSDPAHADTPAASYLAARGTWPPDVALPESVRWLSRAALGAEDRAWHKGLAGAADFTGLLLYTYRPHRRDQRAALFRREWRPIRRARRGSLWGRARQWAAGDPARRGVAHGSPLTAAPGLTAAAGPPMSEPAPPYPVATPSRVCV